MKKTTMMLFIIAFTVIGVWNLQAQDVMWYVGSDADDCSTYFTVGLHDQTVVITQTWVRSNMVPVGGEVDFVTLSPTQHYSSPFVCPNRKYIYRIYFEENGVRTLATNKAFIVKAIDNVTYVNQCYICDEPAGGAKN